MTPDDIKSQRFGVRLLRGVRPEEVSAFLEDVAEAYGDVQKWNTELMERVEGLAKRTPSSDSAWQGGLGVDPYRDAQDRDPA